MKRPYGIYFVAFWLFYGFGIFVFTGFNTHILPVLTEDKDITSLIWIIGLGMIIYVMVGLIQLKLRQRIIAITLFTIVVISYSIDIISLLLIKHALFYSDFPPSMEYTPDNRAVIFAICLDTLIIGLSIKCIVYLRKSGFKEYAAKYLEFKNLKNIQKDFQKTI